jgi:hypothetical protein
VLVTQRFFAVLNTTHMCIFCKLLEKLILQPIEVKPINTTFVFYSQKQKIENTNIVISMKLRPRLFRHKTFSGKGFHFWVFGTVENLDQTKNVFGWLRKRSFTRHKIVYASHLRKPFPPLSLTLHTQRPSDSQTLSSLSPSTAPLRRHCWGFCAAAAAPSLPLSLIFARRTLVSLSHPIII